jgi:methionyl-tRNA formyltransferase
MNKPISYVFFGTGALAESVLASLIRNGYVPSLIVTKPDSPQGRHLQMTPPNIKVWADMKGIPTLQPKKLDAEFSHKLSAISYQLFVVASYGKIIPDDILNIPSYGTLNVHPSLLPKYRGPSPIVSALLDGETTLGVSIMKLDKEMDHGPILVQNAFTVDVEATSGTLEVTCGQLGGDLLAQVLPSYIDGTLIPKEQDHSQATVCKKISKELGEIKLTDSANDVRTKWRALSPWPGLYFFIKHNEKEMRVKITGVDLITPTEDIDTAKDIITSVIPEGKKEMSFESFLRGYIK